MSWCDQCKPVLAMVAVEFALAIVNILLKKVINEGLNNLLIITYRQSISTIFLAPIAYFMERKRRPKLTPSILCYLFVSALVGATLTQYLFLIGLRYTTATFTCAFINLVPVNTFIMALPIGLESVNIKSKEGKAKVLGTLVSLSGVLILTFYKGAPLIKTSAVEKAMIQKTENKRWPVGSIVLTAGSFTWASWFLIQARIGKIYPCQYSSTAYMSLFSSIQSAILCVITDRNISTWILKGKLEISSVIFSGMVGSGLCYVVMSWCVQKRGPVFTAAFSPLVQTFVAMFDVFILHEQIHLGSVLGSVLVIAGMYILLWGKNNEVEDVGIKQAQTAEEENGDCNNRASQLIPVTTNSNNPTRHT